MMRQLLFASVALPTLLCAPLTSAQASQIANGSFETGTLSPWFTSGSGNIGVTSSPVTPQGDKVAVIAYTSPFDAGFATLSQAFTTTSAGTFDYSFLLGRFDGGGFADYGLFFDANIDGTTLSTALPPLAGPLQSYTGSLFLSAGAHQINFNFARSFTLFGRSPFFLIDGVSVQAVGAGVPEPASWAMMITGFGLAGTAARRRTSSAKGRSTTLRLVAKTVG